MGYINNISEPSLDRFYIMDSKLMYCNEMVVVYIPK
jgi:hypothetical protein